VSNHQERLIEISLPLAAISKQSAREKSTRRGHGHISTLHIWWARRPLAAMRAAIFASLIPAPEDDAECQKLERLIETIVDWDQVKNGNSQAIEEARHLIRAAFPDGPPRLLDPFMGDGADTHAGTGFDTLYFRDTLPSGGFAIVEGAWLLRPALAEQLLKKEAPQPQPQPEPTEPPTGQPGPTGPSPPGPTPPPSPPPAIYRRVTIDTPVDWRQWYDFYQAIIKPLVEAGAEVNLQLRIEASGDVDANLVDLSVKESVVQFNPQGKVEAE